LTLESVDLETARREIRDAVDRERPRIEAIRALVRQIHPSELNYRQCYAIAPVATDGGENRISFAPMHIEIIRVVDSEGTEHVQKILPLSAEPEDFARMFQDIPVLRKFTERIGVEFEDLSYLLGLRKSADPGELGKPDSRGVVRTVRDILEWAVLLDMAWNPGRSKILLLRDGLLRAKALTQDAVAKMAVSFEEAYKANGSLILGVAKSSEVLNYLSLGLALEGTFNRNYACFCEVNPKIERASYNWARTWLEGPTFGRLHLVKLVEARDALVLPVDIPAWLMPRRKEVLEYLAETAKTSFPVIGYPHPLVKAHENAVLHGLEMEVLAQYVLTAMIEGGPNEEGPKIQAHVNFGRGSSLGGETS
jgi:hypothetical protein